MESRDATHKDSDKKFARIRQPNIDLKLYAENEYFVASIPWDTMDTVGQLTAISIPQDLLQVEQLQRIFGTTYKARYVEVETTITVRGTNFHQGMLGACYVPVVKTVAQGRFPGNSKISFSHQVADYSVGPSWNPIVIRSSFVNPRDYINTAVNSDNEVAATTGTLVLFVFDPLRTTTASTTTISVVVEVKFIDPEFKLPRPSPVMVAPDPITGDALRGLTFEDVSAASHGSSSDRNLIADTIKNMGALEATQFLTGKFRVEGAKVTKGPVTTSTVYNQTFAGGGNEITNSDTKQGDVFDAEGTSLKGTYGTDLDRPTIDMAPVQVQQRFITNLNLACNDDYAYSMSMQPGEGHGVDFGHTGNHEDEMKFSFFSKKLIYLTSISWTADDAVGTRLFSHYITPSWYVANIFGPIAADTQSQFNIWDVLSGMYAYWSCDFELVFYFPKTAYQNGKVMLATEFGNFTNTNPTLTNANALPRDTYDLHYGLSSWVYPIHFTSDVNMLRTASADLTTTIGELGRSRSTLGKLHLFVRNALTFGEGIPNSINIQMFMRCKNVKFFQTKRQIVKPIAVDLVQGEFRQESGVDAAPEHHATDFPSIETQLHNLKPEDSWRTLIKKYVSAAPDIVGPVDTVGSLSAIEIELADLFTVPSTASAVDHFTTMASCYLGYHGNQRYYFSYTGTGIDAQYEVFLVPYQTQDNIEELMNSNARYLFPFQSLQIDKPLTIDVPYTTVYKYIMTTTAQDENVSSEGDLRAYGRLILRSRAVETGGPTVAVGTVKVWKAGGDNMRLFGFMGPPQSILINIDNL